MMKVSALPLAKLVINVVERTTLELCVSPVDLTQDRDSRRPNGANSFNRKNRCSHRCNVHDIDIENDCHDDNSVDDLADQVQPLFYG